MSSQAEANNADTMSTPKAIARQCEIQTHPRVVSELPPVQQVFTSHLSTDLVSGSRPTTPNFQIFAKLNGATKTIDAASEWTLTDVKAALSDKTGRFLGDEFYLVAPGGKLINDSDVTTIGQCGVGKGGQLECRYRARGGGGVLTRCLDRRPDKASEKAMAAAAAVTTSEPASAAQSTDVTTLGQVAYTSEPPS